MHFIFYKFLYALLLLNCHLFFLTDFMSFLIQHRCDAGESSGGNGPVPVRTIRHKLDIGDGVDDGGREADEGSIAGISDRDVVPEERKAGRVPATLN